MTPVKLSELAKFDLQELKLRIAKESPRGAHAYVQKLKKATNRLRRFPESGWIVQEINVPGIREIVYDRYRVIYFYDGRRVLILRIWPGGRPLSHRAALR